VDALGNVVTWRRDAVGNVVETLVRDGQDGRNPGRTITAAAAVTLTHTVNSFDERNRRYRAERQFFTADVATGVLTPITTDGDGDGWVETATTYDRNGNVTAVTNDKGQTTHYAYDGLGRLSLRTDALDNTTAYTYDGDNNLVQTVATERQPDGLAPAETFTVTCAYDAANRLVSTTDNPSTGSGQALGQASRYAYDSRGNLVFRSDANGPVTANGEWRMANSQSQIANNDHGNTALFAYDGLNRRLSETYHLRAGGLGNGAVTGQVTMTYVYDGNGNLVRRADPNGNETAYVYDPLDRLVRTAYASGTTATYAYDRASNLVRYTDANGSVITHTYDALDRRTRSDVARGLGMGGTTLQTFAWDGLSRLVAATDNNDPATPADDSTLAFTYDSLSNRRSETQNGRAVTHTYDGLGNRLSLTYPGGTALTYTYDELNRVETIADAGGAIATYDYIGPLRLLRRTNGNGTYAAYTYDSARRLTGLAYRLTSNQLLVTSFQYTYDRVGNRLTETAQPDNRQTTYTYDSLYRLVGAQFPAASFQYVYDPAGNRTQVVRDGQATAYTTNEMNEYRSVGGKSYTYDANGNLTLAGAQGYHYDFLGRLIESTPPLRLYLPLALRRGNGASVVAAGSQESAVPWARPAGTVSAYDALGRQAGKRTGSETVRYIYAGGVVIEERDGGGAVRATYVRDLVMQWGSTRIFYQADVLGSVRGLADTTGTVIERVAYDPFGTPIFSGGGSASAWGNPYLFRGARYDAARVLYVYGGRRYEPATGRYLQRGDETLGNPYTFAGNNPVRSTDR
jgi:RHS repeat-associated protein